jgi:hypothetical protein
MCSNVALYLFLNASYSFLFWSHDSHIYLCRKSGVVLKAVIKLTRILTVEERYGTWYICDSWLFHQLKFEQ